MSGALAPRPSYTELLQRIGAVMLAKTGETWPIPGAAWTAAVRVRAIVSTSTSTRALKTARMVPPAERGVTHNADGTVIITVGGEE